MNQESRMCFDLRFGLLWRNPLLDERIPLVALRALPEELRAAVAAAEADVRIEIEDRLSGERHIAAHQRLVETERGQDAPDLLVECQPVRVVCERIEQQVECLARLARGADVA